MHFFFIFLLLFLAGVFILVGKLSENAATDWFETLREPFLYPKDINFIYFIQATNYVVLTFTLLIILFDIDKEYVLYSYLIIVLFVFFWTVAILDYANFHGAIFLMGLVLIFCLVLIANVRKSLTRKLLTVVLVYLMLMLYYSLGFFLLNADKPPPLREHLTYF